MELGIMSRPVRVWFSFGKVRFYYALPCEIPFISLFDVFSFKDSPCTS